MRKLILLGASVAALATAAPANAAVVFLSSVTQEGSLFRYNYAVEFAAGEGVKTGSNFAIFDFLGYVAGSITSLAPFVNTTTELVSGGLPAVPGVSDDPAALNLRFTFSERWVAGGVGVVAYVVVLGLAAVMNDPVYFLIARIVLGRLQQAAPHHRVAAVHAQRRGFGEQRIVAGASIGIHEAHVAQQSLTHDRVAAIQSASERLAHENLVVDMVLQAGLQFGSRRCTPRIAPPRLA